MNDTALPHDETEDERVPMTMDERGVWVYLVAVVVTSGAYLVVMIPRTLSEPIAEISWVTPMLWALGVSVFSTIVGSIVAAIGSAVTISTRGDNPKVELASDERDKEIKRYGDRKTYGILGASMFVTLVLTMIGADLFWIANAVFVFGTTGAIVETIVKIRAYRRGF